MSRWTRFLHWLGLRPDPGPRYYELAGDLHVTLATLATHEGRSEQELAADLLAAGLTHYYTSDDTWQRWQTLSPREQDVAALACLGYANKQIGLRLGISGETVKTHMHNLLVKFNLHTRSELSLVLREWDFSAWEDRQSPPHRP
jgi:DNA-binding CsgD family transcriptional regulator